VPRENVALVCDPDTVMLCPLLQCTDPYPQQFNMYLTPGIVNVIEVYAADEAGNRSAPATMTIDMTTP
jgi:hypothetical protein